MRTAPSCLLVFFGVASLLPAVVQADDSPTSQSAVDSARLEFFESRIRPVLIKSCYECHAADSNTVQGGLLLDSRAATRRGGDSGAAVVPGQPEESLLLSAIKYDSFEMPPQQRLPDHVIADFEVWIKNGAVDPRSGDAPALAPGINLEQGRQFWAFQPPQPAELDDESDYARRIDRLVQQSQGKAIRPNPPASRRTLLRRLTFDLTGLPPTAEQVRQFEQSEDEEAWQQQIDRLLNSPRYGERWARLWLDVARYAEDQAHIVGNNKSLFFPNAWRYRDWVIQALNDDMPYDRFVSLQLAADLLEPDSEEHTAALGFIGIGPKYYRRNDPEVMADEWEDRVDVVMRGLQGLTVACARCHDHKFDPIATEDYYALAGVFASTQMYNRPDAEAESGKDGQAKQPEKSLHVIRDKSPRDLEVMIRGDVNNTGDVVPRGFVQVVFPGDRRHFDTGSGRQELAACLTEPGNPLTARVIVNRVWQQFFGTGIVPTTSNFGAIGGRPTNQQLLDDLAVGFMNHGWSLKWLQRQIVRSDTYQQSSAVAADCLAADSTNASLWRMPRRRLSVEEWRDAVLAVSGRLEESIGGPSIRVDDPEQTRRTIYAQVSRFELNPLLSLFDFPDPNVHASCRMETTTPLQKLFLMNSPFVLAQSKAIAARIPTGSTPSQQVAALFRCTLQRDPDDTELAAMATFLESHPADGLPQAAQVLITGNEFWFVD
ncbi:MAG: PSD1 and planctomycete cytochrome C domain-containing protein [Planctomycetaceae bacterium]|nr:PSD1 and planctomycete cytochrome C domain-containing protein [Planctomycetaceae bacterium]